MNACPTFFGLDYGKRVIVSIHISTSFLQFLSFHKFLSRALLKSKGFHYDLLILWLTEGIL